MAKSYLSFLALLVLAQIASFANAQGAGAVGVPTNIAVFGWVLPYEGLTEYTANVGDTITFRWRGNHNVYIHPTLSCDITGAIFVGDVGGSSYTFTEADGSAEGTDMFFSCDIGAGAHCRAGQFLTVKVFSADGTPPPQSGTIAPAGETVAPVVGETVAPAVGETVAPVVAETVPPETFAPTLRGTGAVTGIVTTPGSGVVTSPFTIVSSVVELPVDGTEPPIDGTEPPVDGTEPPIDGTEPPIDGTEPPIPAVATTIEVFGWVLPFEGLTEYTANVGDTITFRWRGVHNVFIHPSMSCDITDAIFVGATGGSSYTFTEADGSPAGTDMFFSCDIGEGAHCRAGQFLNVRVFSAATTAPEETVAPVVEETKAPIPETEAPTASPPTNAPVPPPTDAPVVDTTGGVNEAISGGRTNTGALMIAVASAGLALVLA